MITITGIVGLALGFLFGPFFEWVGEKVSNSESAKRSEQISIAKYNNKVPGINYDKGSTNDFFNPSKSSDRNDRFYLIITSVFFLSLAGLIIFGNVIYTKILIAVLVIILLPVLFQSSKK